MGRMVAVFSLGLGLFATSASAQVDDLELVPPSETATPPPAVVVPDVGLGSGADSVASPEPIAEPRVTRPPTARVPASPLVSRPSPTPASDADLPVLFGPAEMPDTVPRRPVPDPSRRSVSNESPSRLTLENEPLPPSATRAPKPPTERRSRWFGRASAPSAAPTSPFSPRRTPLTSTPGGRADAIADPAVDLALKRRIDREVREAYGPQLRSLEVLVEDRRVIVQASALRFWQRRALRRAIESLPALAGTRATVHVDD